jgi:hypothetical protein
MNLLVTIMSCQKNCHLWNKLTQISKKNTIIFSGGSDTFYYDKYNNILHLKCNDNYDGLPEKMICMIDQILNMPDFADITHILKIDDHDTQFTYENIINIVKNTKLFNCDYVGQRLHHESRGARKWHFNKVPKNSKWHDKPYNGEYVSWLDGGSSYILSRNAMKIINNHFNISNLDLVSETEIFEDVMIAKILKNNGINPIHINYGVTGDK